MQQETLLSWRSGLIWKLCKSSQGISQGGVHAVHLRQQVYLAPHS